MFLFLDPIDPGTWLLRFHTRRAEGQTRDGKKREKGKGQ
ncbi:hypothetical protein Zm00014a_022264 [Zea mays]|uniref:Uncharacterized protein n=1 Tax=Zea mays TaxID=4577 RepID=A0A3L6FT06_MAIZE|nr:hypothetical protein Zm00014a_022264 [Zea mays]